MPLSYSAIAIARQKRATTEQYQQTKRQLQTAVAKLRCPGHARMLTALEAWIRDNDLGWGNPDSETKVWFSTINTTVGKKDKRRHFEYSLEYWRESGRWLLRVRQGAGSWSDFDTSPEFWSQIRKVSPLQILESAAKRAAEAKYPSPV